MLKASRRAAVWAELDREPWDLLVVGGGISGAGVAREAARTGARVLLLEARDFAYGTSSRSSKMVHGGLRYLAQGQIRITAESVRERERLSAEAPGLVEPMAYTFAHYRGGRWTAMGFRLVLAAYDLLARKWAHRRLSPAEAQVRFPGLNGEGLIAADEFYDTLTDDVRLTLRVLEAAEAEGALALNYARVTGLEKRGEYWQATVVDGDAGAPTQVREPVQVRARVVVNATGVWGDSLRGGAPRLRPLRGSHLLFARERLPVASAIALRHPTDGRILFVYPWAGATVVGTTDLDHQGDLEQEPAITGVEVDYLLAAANRLFPEAALSRADIRSTWAGVRPVIRAEGAPSAQSREHAVWDEDGLITLAGGKLTTFRLMARDALTIAARHCPRLAPVPGDPPVLVTGVMPSISGLDAATTKRLAGFYGPALAELLAVPDALRPVADTDTRWGELVLACRRGAVRHLDDLLLRRTRLGLIVPQGAVDAIPELRDLCRQELGWDDARFEREVREYRARWRSAYALPESITSNNAKNESAHDLA